jgi:hypothetical protein
MDPILLIEGAEGALVPEVAYVRQGDRVWFARGKPDQLVESIDDGVQLVESIELLELEERQVNGAVVKLPKGGRWVLEGPAQRSDVKNANGRLYPREIWNQWIAKEDSPAQVAIRERAMIGHLEHPKDGRTDGKEGALVVTRSTLREDGVVWNQFELLDTPNGLILQEYTRKGVKWGVSSRGTGSVAETGRVNPGDFRLETWDAVMRPSVQGAHPSLSTSGRRTVEDTHVSEPTDAGEAGGASELTEAAQSVLSRATELVNTPIDDAALGDRLRLRRSLVSVLGDLSDGTLPTDRALQSVRSVSERLSALDDRDPQPVDEALEAALRDAEISEGEPSEHGYATVVEDLTSRAASAAEEAETARAQLEEAESARLRSEWRVQELSEQLSEAETARDQASAQLLLAEELLAERPADADAGEIEEAVAAATAEVPALLKVEHVLRLARSCEAVTTLAESLLPLVVREPRPSPPPRATAPKEPVEEATPRPDLSRRTLPTVGEVVSESDIGRTTERRTPVSRGAQLAGAAVGMQK